MLLACIIGIRFRFALILALALSFPLAFAATRVSAAMARNVPGWGEGSSKLIDNESLDVHILHVLSRTKTIADVVGTVKRQTNDWIKGQDWARGSMDFHDFHWQKGYGVFSVSESVVPQVKTYINGQIDHHRKMTFQEEFRAFLKKHGIEYDEKYVWD